MKKILFVPIDNRPVTYSLTEQITAVNKSLTLKMPDRNMMGGLIKKADITGILKWLKNEKDADLIILALDTVAYGGLVPSRRSNETFLEIKEKIQILKEILKEKKKENPNVKIYATSSIMRISNNNINEEEKEYWNLWGKKIFSFSYHQHKSRRLKEYNCVYNLIPEDILNDYLNTRKRNFDINKIYLEWLSLDILDFLIYSKDDTGEFGLNVEEAEILQEEINSKKLNAIVKTGADEIPLGLLSRGITENLPLKIKVVYSNPDSTDKISRYEDISVKECTEAQIKIGIKNAKITNENPDIILYINNFLEKQGDLVFRDIINEFNKELQEFDRPYVIADINNANGADKGLIEEILKKGLNPDFLGYSGYNTSANSIGSALAIGITTYLAQKSKNFDKEAFKKLLFIRLTDDWAYQSEIRKFVQGKENAEEELLNNLKLFETYEEKINDFLKTNFKNKYSLPWKRSFEIETEVTYGN